MSTYVKTNNFVQTSGNVVHIFWSGEKSNIKKIVIARNEDAMKHIDKRYHYRNVVSVEELNTLDLTGKSYPIIIPGCRLKGGKRIETIAARKVEMYKKELIEDIKRYVASEQRDETIDYDSVIRDLLI